MTNHMWVAVRYTPIDIEEFRSDDGIISLHTYTTEAADEIAEEDSILLCWHCHTTLTIESYQTECVNAVAPSAI